MHGTVASSHAREARSRRRGARWFLLAASYGGFVVSLYLTLVHYRGLVSPCFVVYGCEQVQTSRFSAIMGVPVALLGTVFFAVMFYLGIGLLTRSAATPVRLYKVLAFAGALAAIPLFLLQALVLRAFCSYCLAAEAILLSLCVASLLLPSSAHAGGVAGAGAAEQ